MQQTHDQHAPVFRHVKDDVGLMLEAPEVWRELLGTSAEPGIFGEGLKAGFQSVTVTAGLFDTELIDGVIRDLVNVGGGTTG